MAMKHLKEYEGLEDFSKEIYGLTNRVGIHIMSREANPDAVIVQKIVDEFLSRIREAGSDIVEKYVRGRRTYYYEITGANSRDVLDIFRQEKGLLPAPRQIYPFEVTVFAWSHFPQPGTINKISAGVLDWKHDELVTR